MHPKDSGDRLPDRLIRMTAGPTTLNCTCGTKMLGGFLYVRGVGGALLWSESGETPIYSRRGLDQIDLDAMSRGPTGGQAVVPAWRCPDCAMISFLCDQ